MCYAQQIDYTATKEYDIKVGTTTVKVMTATYQQKVDKAASDEIASLISEWNVKYQPKNRNQYALSPDMVKSLIEVNKARINAVVEAITK